MGAAGGKSNNPPESGWERLESPIAVIRAPAGNPIEQLLGPNNLTPADLVARARHELGPAYNLGRPLYKAELARLLGLGDGPGNMIEKLEAGRANLSGPIRVALLMLLDGHRSPKHAEALRPEVRGRRGRPTSGIKR